MQKGKSGSLKIGTMKVKDLFRGRLRSISQIFDDEEQEAEMQIGLPTDVKHVAHIGWDGPSADSPGWMKGFEPSGEGHQEFPMASNSSGEEQPYVPKSMRRVSSPKRGKSSRQSSKHHLKDSKSTKLTQDGGVAGSDSSAGDLPKKPSRRKKSKDSGSSRSSKSRGSGSGSGLPTFCSDQECSYEPNCTK